MILLHYVDRNWLFVSTSAPSPTVARLGRVLGQLVPVKWVGGASTDGD